MTNETELISIMEAARRSETGEWITDLKVSNKVAAQANKIREQLTDWTDTPHDKIDFQMLEDIYQIVPDCLTSQLEHAFIHHPPGNLYATELRVTSNVVYKIKPTVLNATIHFLSLMLALSTVSPFPLLFTAWFALSSIQLAQTIWKGWESIGDPEEKLVFETVYKLQNRLCVTNYDALDQKDFASAFDCVSPSFQELALDLIPKLKENEIESALASLEKRNIIVCKNSRYSISF